MTPNVAAESYDRFMGRYSSKLAPQLADLADVRAGQRAIDVGCGPGALTGELVRRLGPAGVRAVDPSEPYVQAARERHPGVDIRIAGAEQLPFADQTFDVALAQLVVQFVRDPVAGIREMARVTRVEGTVAACVWDHAGRRAPISTFWDAASESDPGLNDESDLPGVREGHLIDLFRLAGLRDVRGTALTTSAELATFEEWWEPFNLGLGPAGAYAKRASEARLATIRERCRELLGPGPIVITAVAWSARGMV